MHTIKRLTGREILDSRGCPTLEATCELQGGARASASVPSGASTGSAEAKVLRDGDANRYAGLGCLKAVGHIQKELHNALSGQSFSRQKDLDQTLIKLDQTEDKSALGANTLLAVSLAYARAATIDLGVPLYEYFAGILDLPVEKLPRPTINLFSGGKHAGGQVPLQDVMLVPTSSQTINEALSMTFAVYQCAIRLIEHKYSMRPLTADEGGLAPPFPTAESMLQDAVESITMAGFKPGTDMALAIDVAATHFFRNGHYYLADRPLESETMIEHLLQWTRDYPIISIEDGLGEDDWSHWPLLCQAMADRAVVIGDDLLCTNPKRIRRAVETKAVNGLLLKVNQVGTLTEAAQAHRLSRAADWKVSVSARSGETEDNWLADLAVGWSGEYIKVGSITHSERLAKYNRLLAIEEATGLPLSR